MRECFLRPEKRARNFRRNIGCGRCTMHLPQHSFSTEKENGRAAEGASPVPAPVRTFSCRMRNVFSGSDQPISRCLWSRRRYAGPNGSSGPVCARMRRRPGGRVSIRLCLLRRGSRGAHSGNPERDGRATAAFPSLFPAALSGGSAEARRRLPARAAFARVRGRRPGRFFMKKIFRGGAADPFFCRPPRSCGRLRISPIRSRLRKKLDSLFPGGI